MSSYKTFNITVRLPSEISKDDEALASFSKGLIFTGEALKSLESLKTLYLLDRLGLRLDSTEPKDMSLFIAQQAAIDSSIALLDSLITYHYHNTTSPETE